MSLFYEVEDAIIARLEAKFATLNPLPKVKHGSDLANIKDKSQGDLTVFVAYNGISEVKEASETVRCIGTVTNEYMIVVVARSAKDNDSRFGTRELADPVLEKVIAALMGWQPLAKTEQLRLDGSLEPVYQNGFGYFTLVFTHRKSVRGEP